MRTIWKYPLANPATGPTRIPLPVGGYLLRAAAVQGDQLVVWAVLDTDAPRIAPAFVEAVNTGQPLDDVAIGDVPVRGDHHRLILAGRETLLHLVDEGVAIHRPLLAGRVAQRDAAILAHQQFQRRHRRRRAPADGRQFHHAGVDLTGHFLRGISALHFSS